MIRLSLAIVLLFMGAGSILGQGAGSPVTLTVDFAAKGPSLPPMWAYFGYDEPNYTYMKDGRKLLGELAALSRVPVYVRCHNLLTTGDGKAAFKWGSSNAYTEDAQGHPVYDWHIVDSIFDTYVHLGMKPLAEIGFMPEALSTHPEPYRHHWKPGVSYDSIYTGWAWPPTDYKKWGELVYQWVRHCVGRYGEKEVASWLWEVWNEPNISYWKGTLDEYLTIYDYAADGVKRALPAARVGGPATTGPSWDKAAGWLEKFLEHCSKGTNAVTGKQGAPLDFISYHAKGSPKFIAATTGGAGATAGGAAAGGTEGPGGGTPGHVRMNMAPQLRDVAKGFSIVKASSFSKLPIYITECDPEGCAACGMSTNPENAYRNGTMYSSYTASSFARIYDLADRYGVNLAGAISWSFEFEDQKWFDGFRDLATNGIDKPVLNVFRMYGRMPGKRIPVGNDQELSLDTLLRHSVSGGALDINALATGDHKNLAIMIWNYQDDDLPGPPSSTNLVLKNCPAGRATFRFLTIDDHHSNAYEVWKKMGSPQSVTEEQYKKLEAAGQLQEAYPDRQVKIPANGEFRQSIGLPRHSVSLLLLSF